MRSGSALFALLLACSSEPTQPAVPANEPPIEAPAPPTKAPEPPPPKLDPLTCSSDLDCDVCGTKTGCDCMLAGTAEASERCGETQDACLVAPCHAKSASCARSKCVLRPAPASRCETDSDCEVRDDDCACDLFAALAAAPVVALCPGKGCGGRPAKSQWMARCDADKHRCVLERAPG